MTFKAAFSFADGKTLFCPVGEQESVLDAALKNGIRLPFDCREGVCATCKGQCESGKYSQQYVDEDALNADDLSNGKVLTCQTHLHSDATFSFNFDSSLCTGEQACYSGLVSDIQHISPTTAVLKIAMDDAHGGPEYLPGQYARLTVPGSECQRAYSFSNWPAGGNIEFLVRMLADGKMSQYLRETCKPGDRITLDAPYGTFYLRDITRPVVMAAGGTGLSAFLAMLDSIAARGTTFPIHLYYGVRTAEDICELERLIGYQSSMSTFSFDIVLSNPGPGWRGKTGYITDHLSPSETWQNGVDLYVCGPPGMVDSISHWLSQASLPATRLYYEKFLSS